MTIVAQQETIDTLRDRMLNSMLLVSAVLAVPAVATSLWRMAVLGWKPVMAIHIVLLVVLWSLWLWRRRLSYGARAASLMAIYWVIGTAGYVQLGPAAGGGGFFMMLAFAGMLLFSERIGRVVVIVVVASVVAIGYAASRDWLQYDLDFQLYAHHPATWLNIVWSVSAFSAVLAYIAWSMVHGVRRLDDATRELAERQRKIGNNLPGVIYQYLLRHDGTSCFPYASVGISNIYGVMPEEVRDDASAVFAVLHPGDKDHIGRTIVDSARDLTPWHAEYRVVHPWKGEIWVEGLATPERLPNGDVIWHGFISDITERKRAENVKSEFVSVVSHELRTPLTSIRGSLGLIVGGAGGELSEQSRSLVSVALRNSERLGSLINDLLDIEKLTSGKMTLSLVTQPLMPIVDQALAAHQGYAELHDVKFVLSRRIEQGDVCVDAARLQQVLANFMSNAAKFSPKHAVVDLAVTASDEFLRVSVTDHGHGIPEEFRSHVFEKFSQADPSDTRAKGGTGLGLAISKEIIERMKGRVGYDSVPDEHTTFWFELPRASAPV